MILDKFIEEMWLNRHNWLLLLLLFIHRPILVDLCDWDYICVYVEMGKGPGEAVVTLVVVEMGKRNGNR